VIVPRTKLRQNLAMILKMHQPQAEISGNPHLNGAAKSVVPNLSDTKLVSDL
jgi:hypothetical protein